MARQCIQVATLPRCGAAPKNLRFLMPANIVVDAAGRRFFLFIDGIEGWCLGHDWCSFFDLMAKDSRPSRAVQVTRRGDRGAAGKSLIC
jgi:hypothetical protein